MKISNSHSTLFLSSLLLSITQHSLPTLAHGTHSDLVPRHQLYPHNISGRYSSSHNGVRSSPTSGINARSNGGKILRARHLVKNSKRSRRKHSDPVGVAEDYIRKETEPGTTWELDSTYTDENDGVEMTHVFAVQTWKGKRIDNARFNVNVLRDGTIFSSGSSFVPMSSLGKRDIERRQKKINPLDALTGAVQTLHIGDGSNMKNAKAGKTGSNERYKLTGSKAHKKNKWYKQPEVIIDGVNGVHSKPEATLVYMQNPDGTLELTWRLEYDSESHWLLIYADAYEKNKIHSVADYTAHATYEVYNFNVGDPSEGERTLEVDPFQKDVSPRGWHAWNSQEFTTLQGNNVITVINTGIDAGNKDLYDLETVDGGKDKKFVFPYPITSLNYMDWAEAASVQMFYTCNMIHDLYEQLGFTSPSGNFEEELMGETGGEGEDAVAVHVLYGAPFNQSNAMMATPPDGERPRMMMFIWPNPNGNHLSFRDSAFDRDVVIHEYTHGLSTRLTGGPEDSTCLNGNWESRGMGEGWGDFFAMGVRMEPSDTRDMDYRMAAWLISPDADPNHPGLRRYPYSTDLTRNPLLYSSMDELDTWGKPHSIGTIWCTMLVELLWNLAEKHGVESSKFPKFTGKSKVPTDGRHLAMKLVLEGMKLQPCSPTFEDARDAIIDADVVLTDGDNYCEIWKAFAKRGLGVDASNESVDVNTPVHIDGFALPDECS